MIGQATLKKNEKGEKARLATFGLIRNSPMVSLGLPGAYVMDRTRFLFDPTTTGTTRQRLTSLMPELHASISRYVHPLALETFKKHSNETEI